MIIHTTAALDLVTAHHLAGWCQCCQEWVRAKVYARAVAANGKVLRCRTCRTIVTALSDCEPDDVRISNQEHAAALKRAPVITKMVASTARSQPKRPPTEHPLITAVRHRLRSACSTRRYR